MVRPRTISWFLVLIIVNYVSSLNSAWRWECVSGYCQKREITPDTEESALSLGACRLLCSTSSGLWPLPTGKVSISKTLLPIDPNSIEIINTKTSTPISNLILRISTNFKNQIQQLLPNQLRAVNGKRLVIRFNIIDPSIRKLALDTDESYQLYVSEDIDGNINATVAAETYFGSRHALETLGQLIVADDLRDQLILPSQVEITDKPAYPHRGILLDTSRNYVDVDTIKRTINGMGASKLNNFHWHITDSHSFPYVSASRPELTKYGAYSPRKIYSASDISDIIEFGLERGVRVIPEFDAPAHVGEGWQNTSLVVCFNAQPWMNYCVEPPCGQFDPTQEKLYDILEDIYGDMISQFDPDFFYMGGDEVHFGCWQSVPSIVAWMEEQGWGTTEADFVKLWNVFQSKAAARLYKKAGREIPIVMWTSTLTKPQYVRTSLPKDKYIIQVWTTGTDSEISQLLDKGYQIILSNYDALYLDCGFAGWVTDGNNWCAPYIGWQKVYSNTPQSIAGDRKNQVLGGEATLWTEQADSSSVDSRLWPRAAALAEVLWTEPQTGWRNAEPRILIHRERLVARGIAADALEPEWCWQNEENCPMDGKAIKDEDSGPDDSGAVTIEVSTNLGLIYFIILKYIF